MKKYYMSFVDFSEIINVTADEELLGKAWRPYDPNWNCSLKKAIPAPHRSGLWLRLKPGPFYDKLKKRISRRPGGIAGVKNTMQKLYDRKEYTALFLYLAILYGFLEWQVPEKILLLPAVPDALKIFEGDFLSVFDERLAAEASGESTDAQTETENL